MTHRDGFPRLSARSAWRGDAGHRKPPATPSESLGKPPPVARANRQWAIRRRASESLADVPHRPRLPSYPPIGPTDRLPDLYGSLSTLLGIRAGPPSNRADAPSIFHVIEHVIESAAKFLIPTSFGTFLPSCAEPSAGHNLCRAGTSIGRNVH